MTEGESPFWNPLEVTKSRRQLHEMEADHWTRVSATAHCDATFFPARACGVEARGLPQHRTQVKPRKASLSGLACLVT